MPFQGSHNCLVSLNGNRISGFEGMVFHKKNFTNSANSRLPALDWHNFQYYQSRFAKNDFLVIVQWRWRNDRVG